MTVPISADIRKCLLMYNSFYFNITEHRQTIMEITGVQLPSPPLFELTSYGSRESIEVSEGLPSGL